MSHRVLQLASFTAVLAVMSACARSAAPGARGQAEYLVGVWSGPEASGGEPVPHLTLITISSYSCLGYVIETESRLAGDVLDLNIAGVSPPDGPCPAALGPAGAQIRLPDHGTYTVLISSASRTGAPDQYELTIGERLIELRTKRSTFTAPSNQRAARNRSTPGP